MTFAAQHTMHTKAFPLDLARTAYSYVERPNPAILSLLAKHIICARSDARILDVGCGCGANARAIRERSGSVKVVGIEPNARAAELARHACEDVFNGTLDEWRRGVQDPAPFDALVLSDVLEHVADPIGFVREIRTLSAVRDALWIVSVPNYAVWYNRVATLFGVQRYAWSGLWDRTHLRVYTRRSVRELLEYCGLSMVDEGCTPSFVQSTAPALRKLFERDVEKGEHLALADSSAYKLYQSVVEPVETRLCALWPELLGFQVVLAARGRPDG
ncbi:MAG TPA: class I SAM-dependent methyltransferase [Polyangiaceae bacterium]|jgi:SAM-dependent methyltransferase|nr:class I SAM-dependent methyltransferase [Polyangiaceae bacterium]